MTATLLLLVLTAQSGGLEPIGKNAEGFEEFRNPRDGATLVLIPEGEFLSGKDRKPKRLGAYFISKYEITNDQFRRFLRETGREPHRYKEHHFLFSEAGQPVTYISTPDLAAEYATWAGGRLPGSDEWEKAARGTDGRDYPWGKESTPEGATWPIPLWDD